MPVKKLKKDDPLHVWERRIKKKFGIDRHFYKRMMDDQGGLCWICHRPPKKNRLSIDHDHKTGAIRGLLCWMCNKNLGRIRDKANVAEQMAAYLRQKNKWGIVPDLKFANKRK